MLEKNERILVKILSWTFFIIYLIGMFYFLFFSERYGRTDEIDEYRYNLVLFRELKRIIKNYRILGFEFVFVNLVGNVLAFAPFGMCVPLISKNDDSFFRVFLASFCFSFIIEAIQLIYKIGCFDVDDLFLNTIGGVLGFFLYRMAKHSLEQRKKGVLYAQEKR